MWSEDRLARLCLASFPGFGSRSLHRLWETFSNPKEAWLAHIPELIRAGIKEKTAIKFVEWRRIFRPDQLIKQIERENVRVVFRQDADFPQSLEMTADPPEILFIRGTLKDTPNIAVVGTRHLTTYGKQCIERIVPALAIAGFGIVSGLALGIDGEAHLATLNAKGYTVAVLGTGVDDKSLYPREHFTLAHQIIEKGGAIISEFPLGSESRREHFPMRNRLIAGLSLATLVVEATEDSGSLITAKCALEENREVLAVPGPIWNEQSKGTNNLLKSGAKVCTSVHDILEALEFDQPAMIANARAELPIDTIERAILNHLSDPKHIDELAESLSQDIATISGKMALLEMKGFIKPIGGQMWAKGK